MSSPKWNPSRTIPSKAQWKAFKKEKNIKSGISTVQMGNAFENYHVVRPKVTPFRSRVEENRRVLAEKLDTYISDFESKYGQGGGGDKQDVYDILQKVKAKLAKLRKVEDAVSTPSREQWEAYVDEMEIPDEIFEGSNAPDLSTAFANFDQWRQGKITGIGRSTPEECYVAYSKLLTELNRFRTRLLNLQTDYAANMTVLYDMEFIKAYVNKMVDMYYRLAHAVQFFTEKLRKAHDLFNNLDGDNKGGINHGWKNEFRSIGVAIAALKRSTGVDKQKAKAIDKVYQKEQREVDKLANGSGDAAELLKQMKVAVQKVNEACIQHNLWGNDDGDDDNGAGLHSIHLNRFRTARNLNDNNNKKSTFQDAEVYWV